MRDDGERQEGTDSSSAAVVEASALGEAHVLEEAAQG
jgi:hypothetical protein